MCAIITANCARGLSVAPTGPLHRRLSQRPRANTISPSGSGYPRRNPGVSFVFSRLLGSFGCFCIRTPPGRRFPDLGFVWQFYISRRIPAPPPSPLRFTSFGIRARFLGPIPAGDLSRAHLWPRIRIPFKYSVVKELLYSARGYTCELPLPAERARSALKSLQKSSVARRELADGTRTPGPATVYSGNNANVHTEPPVGILPCV